MSSGYGFAAFNGGVTWIGEPRKTKAGKTVVNFSVAVSKDRKNDDGTWTQDGGGKYFESVTAFGRLADNVLTTFKPGDRVIVIGERDPKPSYTDGKGVEHQNENQVTAKAVGPNVEMWPWKAIRESSGENTSRPKAATQHHSAPKAAPVTSSSDDDEEDDW
jgi:single-stranded DNA-binding protein